MYRRTLALLMLVIGTGCGATSDDGETAVADAAEGNGRFRLSWNLESMGTATTCEQVGAFGVKVWARGEGGTNSLQVITCSGSEGDGFTLDVPLDAYVVDVSLAQNAADFPDLLPPTRVEVSLTVPDATVDLGHFAFRL